MCATRRPIEMARSCWVGEESRDGDFIPNLSKRDTMNYASAGPIKSCH